LTAARQFFAAIDLRLSHSWVGRPDYPADAMDRLFRSRAAFVAASDPLGVGVTQQPDEIGHAGAILIVRVIGFRRWERPMSAEDIQEREHAYGPLLQAKRVAAQNCSKITEKSRIASFSPWAFQQRCL
jgi:hypothetical protein